VTEDTMAKIKEKMINNQWSTKHCRQN